MRRERLWHCADSKEKGAAPSPFLERSAFLVQLSECFELKISHLLSKEKALCLAASKTCSVDTGSKSG